MFVVVQEEAYEAVAEEDKVREAGCERRRPLRALHRLH